MRKQVTRNAKGLNFHNGAWRFRVSSEGKQVWITVPRELQGQTEALQWKNRYLGQDVTARVLPTKTTVGEYAAVWIAESKLKDRTRKLYESHFRGHLSHLNRKKLSEVTAADIRATIYRMRELSLAENTIRNTLVPLRAMFNSAVARGELAVTPFNGLEKRDRPKPSARSNRLMLDSTQATELIVAAGRFGPLVALGVMGGLRISEALGLTWGSVNFERKTIHVTHQLSYTRPWELLPLKGGEEDDIHDRTVEMSETLAKVLRRHRGDRIVHADEFVMQTKTGNPISQRNAQRAFAQATARLDLDLTFHGLRHNFASLLIGSGADVGFVADQLGHRDANITLGLYRHEFTAARERGSGAAAVDSFYAVRS